VKKDGLLLELNLIEPYFAEIGIFREPKKAIWPKI